MATTGPGKSFFLYYVLLRRLSGKSPTAFQLSDRVIFFDEDGPLEFSGIPDGTLALADSTPNNKVPCQAFLSAAKAQVARVIQARGDKHSRVRLSFASVSFLAKRFSQQKATRSQT